MLNISLLVSGKMGMRSTRKKEGPSGGCHAFLSTVATSYFFHSSVVVFETVAQQEIVSNGGATIVVTLHQKRIYEFMSAHTVILFYFFLYFVDAQVIFMRMCVVKHNVFFSSFRFFVCQKCFPRIGVFMYLMDVCYAYYQQEHYFMYIFFFSTECSIHTIFFFWLWHIWHIKLLLHLHY